jgi:hypothetical protein
MSYATSRANPMGEVRLPHNLNAGPNVYALATQGDCMSPEIEHGDVLICDPDAEIRAGDMVAVWFKGGRDPSVKRLVLGLPPRDLWDTPDLQGMLICGQLNPPKRLSARLSTIEAVHRVIGKAEKD